MSEKINDLNHEKITAEAEAAKRQDAARRRMVYEKPGILYQAPLEAMAATCTVSPGKASGFCTSAFS
jgi:hypothetical protein